MAAMTVGLAMTGAMMTSCSKIDNPTDNPGEGLPGGQTVDLSMLMSDYVAQDGDTLRGTLDDNTQPHSHHPRDRPHLRDPRPPLTSLNGDCP